MTFKNDSLIYNVTSIALKLGTRDYHSLATATGILFAQ